mmetsp:Transcript_16000/g.26991  ORF Transcript_16000/g.26991 Transcript_16000/m.26991 type:complete len:170 (+) Transcript_16000:1-510(+)
MSTGGDELAEGQELTYKKENTTVQSLAGPLVQDQAQGAHTRKNNSYLEHVEIKNMINDFEKAGKLMNVSSQFGSTVQRPQDNKEKTVSSFNNGIETFNKVTENEPPLRNSMSSTRGILKRFKDGQNIQVIDSFSRRNLKMNMSQVNKQSGDNSEPERAPNNASNRKLRY